MQAIRTKLGKLEKAIIGGGGMLAVVMAGSQPLEAIHGVVRSAGVDPDHRDNLVVVIRALNENHDGSVDHDNYPDAELLYTMKMK